MKQSRVVGLIDLLGDIFLETNMQGFWRDGNYILVGTLEERIEKQRNEIERLRDGIDDVRCQLAQNNISKAGAADWLKELLSPNAGIEAP